VLHDVGAHVEEVALVLDGMKARFASWARPGRTAAHFVDEEPELAALVVSDDDAMILELVGELLRHMVMKGMHQAFSPATMRRIPSQNALKLCDLFRCSSNSGPTRRAPSTF
jgi:hypothetical protein